LIADVSHQLLEHILERHDPGGSTELIEHHGQVALPSQHLEEHVAAVLRGGSVRDLVHERLLVRTHLEYIEDVDHPHHFVERPAVERAATVARPGNGTCHLLGWSRNVQREDGRPRRHHVTNGLLAELHYAGDYLELFGLPDPLHFALAEERLQP